VRKILNETLDGKSRFRLTVLWELFFQLIAQKATVTDMLALEIQKNGLGSLSPKICKTGVYLFLKSKIYEVWTPNW
jgi:hypothetical protein